MPVNRFRQLKKMDINTYWSLSIDYLEQIAQEYFKEIKQENIAPSDIEENRPFVLHPNGQPIIKRGDYFIVPQGNGISSGRSIPVNERRRFDLVIYADEYERYLEIMSIYEARLLKFTGGSKYCRHIYYTNSLYSSCHACGATSINAVLLNQNQSQG